MTGSHARKDAVATLFSTYNAHAIESILRHVAPDLGWR